MLINYPGLMITALMLFAAAGPGYTATNYYVWRDNPSPNDPFTNWSMAATNIQLAVDKTLAGDTVYVTNGIYDTGGAVTPSYKLTNRVCITKAITVCSMNGPGLTIIKGAEAPGGGMDTGAVRCVYMANVAASLVGFTLTGGYTMKTDDAVYDRSGGGVYLRSPAVVSDCVISGNKASNAGGGAFVVGSINNCTIVSNTANDAGGVYIGTGSTMNDCTITSNTAIGTGGGVYMSGSTATNCMITSNTAANGGGVYIGAGSTMNNCTIASNTAPLGSGGGAYISGGGMANNCMVANNTSKDYGGGVYLNASASSLNNCAIINNSGTYGGGVMCYFDITINNCTVMSNTTGIGIQMQGRATGTGTVNNCIVWGNPAGDFSVWAVPVSINYTCSSPAQTAYGSGNIGVDPMLVNAGSGNYRLAKGSPCINTGSNISWMTDSTDARNKDLDGHSRIDRFTGIVDMGAYEYLLSGTMFRGF